MEKNIRKGQFKVIDSFAIRNRNEFYLIGEVKEGLVLDNWFINVAFNSALAMTLRILAIEDVEISSENRLYKLLIVSADDEMLNLLLALNIGSELLDVTMHGED